MGETKQIKLSVTDVKPIQVNRQSQHGGVHMGSCRRRVMQSSQN